MKKLTTKLLMSIIAVAFAFVALGTSTYAWFSMNTSVSAQGLEITAKADQTFLLISTTNTSATAIQTENSKEADFDMAAAAELYPVTFSTTASLTALNTATNWKVANSDNPDDAKVDAPQTALASDADLTKYVLMDEVYVTVAKDAVPATNLVVKSITIPANKGIKVAIATADGAKIFSASSTTADDTVLAASISDSTVITVKVFVYFDGTDTNVKQTNLANLAGEISFELRVDD